MNPISINQFQQTQGNFITSFDALCGYQTEAMAAKGFEHENDGEKIALMHSELSEALESLRHNDPPSDHIPKFKGSEEELADCIIRIMHFAGVRDLKVGEAVIAKMKFNETRPHKHGKQF